jgi:hypothetical protein
VEPELVVAPPAAAPVPEAPQPGTFVPESPQPAAPVLPPPTAPAAGDPASPAVTSYPDLVPVKEWDAVRVVREAGTSWNVVGEGYAPGAEIRVFFGPRQSDGESLAIPVVYADASGRYSVRITLSADFTPGSYGFMVVDMPFAEERKRFASVEVVAPS